MSGRGTVQGVRIQTGGVGFECFVTGPFLLSIRISTSLGSYVTQTLPGWFLNKIMALQIPKDVSQRKYFKLKGCFIFVVIIGFLPVPSKKLQRM